MDAILRRTLIAAVGGAVIEHAEELTALDQAIGDGDHGLNMKRGFEAVLAQLDGLAAKPLPDALKALGTTLVMKVGGASGPLYGTLFMTLGKELPEQPGLADTRRALAGAIDAVKKIGKSDAGQKTMLDVLVPVLEELEHGDERLAERVKARARAAAQATIPMQAIKGRASFLGARSIGHMDPGARSASLMVAVVCDTLEG
jgi:phosphoenolpyruvate---glycerone phosphotransferase subunit DhaL